MANYLEFSDEELVRVGRLALRSLQFEKAYEVFGVYAQRAGVEERAIPAGILANYALTIGHWLRSFGSATGGMAEVLANSATASGSPSRNASDANAIPNEQTAKDMKSV